LAGKYSRSREAYTKDNLKMRPNMATGGRYGTMEIIMRGASAWIRGKAQENLCRKVEELNQDSGRVINS